MSRFGNDDAEGITWELWETIVSNALGGRKGQAALAEMESALLALPEPKLIEGHLAAEGAVCAIGALVAAKRAADQGVDIATVIDAMSVGVACYCGPCYCDGEYELEESEDWYETTEAGRAAGLTHTVAWHLAYLNDEQFAGLTPEERYARMLSWVRKAQGKPVMAADAASESVVKPEPSRPSGSER